MPTNNDHSSPLPGPARSITGRTKWAVGIAVAVLVVAVAGLGLTSILADAWVLPVVAISIAVTGGAAIAVWIIERYPAWPFMGQPAEAPRMVVLALVGLAVALTGAVLVARPLLVWPTNTEAAQTGEQSSAEQRTQTQAVGLICVGVGLWVLREGLPAPG